MILDLAKKYHEIQHNFEKIRNFETEKLNISRKLFDFADHKIIPRQFEVWTCLVGLPLPQQLTTNLIKITEQVEAILPVKTSFYKIIPNYYHWELFIIKRPQETVHQDQLKSAQLILQEHLHQCPSFDLNYRGFLITPDGVVITKGYSEFNFNHLRSKLKMVLPFASSQQSQLGHISLGRILSPLDSESFIRLKQLVRDSSGIDYGKLRVDQVKYVHEQQWYMEQHEVINYFPLS